jgi:hypothetical protein
LEADPALLAAVAEVVGGAVGLQPDFILGSSAHVVHASKTCAYCGKASRVA